MANLIPGKKAAKLPRSRKESKWPEAKAFALDMVRERGEVPSPEVVAALNREFQFKSEASPYNVINTLIRDRRIHYDIISGNTRLLKMGPGRGPAVILDRLDRREMEPEAKMEPEAEEELQSSEAIEVVEVQVEVQEETEVIAVQQVEAMTAGTSSENAEQEAMERVTRDTAKVILNAVDKELERALTPETKAKLRLVAAMAREAGLDVETSDSSLRLRDALRRSFE